jgi:hypothetical protein
MDCNKFLTERSIRDIYGVVETPDPPGLIDPSEVDNFAFIKERSGLRKTIPNRTDSRNR